MKNSIRTLLKSSLRYSDTLVLFSDTSKKIFFVLPGFSKAVYLNASEYYSSGDFWNSVYATIYPRVIGGTFLPVIMQINDSLEQIRAGETPVNSNWVDWSESFTKMYQEEENPPQVQTSPAATVYVRPAFDSSQQAQLSIINLLWSSVTFPDTIITFDDIQGRIIFRTPAHLDYGSAIFVSALRDIELKYVGALDSAIDFDKDARLYWTKVYDVIYTLIKSNDKDFIGIIGQMNSNIEQLRNNQFPKNVSLVRVLNNGTYADVIPENAPKVFDIASGVTPITSTQDANINTVSGSPWNSDGTLKEAAKELAVASGLAELNGLVFNPVEPPVVDFGSTLKGGNAVNNVPIVKEPIDEPNLPITPVPAAPVVTQPIDETLINVKPAPNTPGVITQPIKDTGGALVQEETTATSAASFPIIVAVILVLVFIGFFWKSAS